MGRLSDLLRRWSLHAQRLFHFSIGVVFLVLAFGGASVALREWNYYQRAPATVGPARFWILTGFTALLVVMGLYSFLKARSVR